MIRKWQLRRVEASVVSGTLRWSFLPYFLLFVEEVIVRDLVPQRRRVVILLLL